MFYLCNKLKEKRKIEFVNYELDMSIGVRVIEASET